MDMMRAGLLAVLVGTAAVGATQYSKPGHGSSTGWTVERQGPPAGEHAGRRTTGRTNPGAGRRGWRWGHDRGNRRSAGTEWADEWQAGWSRKHRAGRNTRRVGGLDGTHARGGPHGGTRSRRWTFEGSGGRAAARRGGRGAGRSADHGYDRSRGGERSVGGNRYWSGDRLGRRSHGGYDRAGDRNGGRLPG
ncbi:hypothetical protein ACFYY8_15390 [Streptosporangium sp. NPDC001559]|uniref:hypothetical protein n=1 Tax=Streptosporangium sp. NPDC001559 TaxID=3366187 RepID=UPI0036E296B9